MKKNSHSSGTRARKNWRYDFLEERILPTVTIEVGIDLDLDGANDDLRIVGGSESTTIRIDDEGVGSGTLTIDVDINGDGDFLDAGELLDSVLNVADDTATFELNLGKGNDTVEYTLVGALQGSVRQLSIDLGKGNDTFRYRSGVNNIESGSRLSLDVLAGIGNDTVDAIFADILNSEVLYQAILGVGNDVGNLDFSVSGGADVDQGATFQGNIDLGAGTNELDLDFAADVGETTASKVDLDVVGGANVDTISMSSRILIGNGSNASSFLIDIDTGSGDDVVDADYSLMEVALHSLLTTTVYGRAGNDTIRSDYLGTLVSDIFGVVDLDFEGGTGNDTIQVDHNVSSIATLSVFGQYRLHVDGNEGDDILRADAKIGNSSNGNLDIAVYGQAGADQVTFNLIRGTATATLGRTGRVVLDGGLGEDTLDNNAAAGIAIAYSFESFIT